MKYSPFENEGNKSNQEITDPLLLQMLNNYSDLTDAIYLNLKNEYLLNFETPNEIYPKPTEDDYKEGKFTRYFIKKRNNSAAPIIEIDDRQFNRANYSKGGIDKNLYKVIELDWKITGPKNDVLKLGMIVVFGVEDTNKRTLILKEKEMSGILEKLTNLTEHAQLDMSPLPNMVEK